MHMGVFIKPLNPHESTESRSGDAADADGDGVGLPDLDSRTADTCGRATVKEWPSEHFAFELGAVLRLAIQYTEAAA